MEVVISILLVCFVCVFWVWLLARQSKDKVRRYSRRKQKTKKIKRQRKKQHRREAKRGDDPGQHRQ